MSDPSHATRQIAIYGKGGIGKSTVASNVAAVLAQGGHRVLQMGCDPKRDSTRAHGGGPPRPTVLDHLQQGRSLRSLSKDLVVTDLVREGRDGVHCIEAGGPEPGVGCAGRGIVATMEVLTGVGLFQQPYDAVLYDVLGDVVCGGFAMPIRRGYAQDVYLVVSGEFLALYAANNIARGVRRYAATGPTRLAGVIGNLREVPHESTIIREFAAGLGCEVVALLPRSPLVIDAENARQTVVERHPDSEPTAAYRRLAARMLAGGPRVVPTPLEDDAIEALVIRAHTG